MPTSTHYIVMGYELARDVAVYLGTTGLGTFGDDIKVDEMPDNPVEMISVTGEDGLIAPGQVISSPVIRVTVRDKEKKLARPRMMQVYELLHRQRPPLERFYAFFIAESHDDYGKNVNNRYVYEVRLATMAHPK